MFCVFYLFWGIQFFTFAGEKLNEQDKIICSYLITLSKDVAPCRVSQDHPVHTTVLDHCRAGRPEAFP